MCTFLRFFTDAKNSKKGQSGGDSNRETHEEVAETVNFDALIFYVSF